MVRTDTNAQIVSTKILFVVPVTRPAIWLENAQVSRGTKQITVVSPSESESDIESELKSDVFSASLYKVGKHGIDVSVELEGVSVNMELDTGAESLGRDI